MLVEKTQYPNELLGFLSLFLSNCCNLNSVGMDDIHCVQHYL